MFFDKPFDAITLGDVQWLVQTQVPESTDLEYKRELAGEKGAPDPWQSGTDKIGRTAITSIVKELVAFANAGGGYLVLGVAESQDKPARAAAIAPVRAADELAERLKRICRDNIEPPIFGLDVRALADQESEAGVVILKIAESPYGPHRSRCDKECYVRKNEDSVPMTMDEIHRRVIEMGRRLDRIDAWFTQQRLQGVDAGWAIRAVARPMGPFLLPGVHKERNAHPVIRPIKVHSNKGAGWLTNMWASALNWRPVVRGTKCADDHGNSSVTTLEVYEDGSIVFDWRWPRKLEEREKGLCMDWFAATFGNLLLSIERLRLVANNPVEFGVEVSVAVHGEALTRKPYWDNWHGAMSTGRFPVGASTLGRYPVGASSTFAEITKLFETDVCHLAGAEATDITFFDYTADLAALRGQLGVAA